jgi:hypothetical protein
MKRSRIMGISAYYSAASRLRHPALCKAGEVC